MKKSLLLSILFCILISQSASASSIPDSVGFKRSQGKNFIIHRVENAEGWFSIARMYGISYAELRLANKDSADKLIPGRTVLVPTDKLKANDPHFEKNYTQDDDLYYNVKEGETLFSIAKKFYTNVDSLKRWNHLTDTELKPGRQLRVGTKSKLDGREPETAEENYSKHPADVKVDTASILKKSTEPLESKNLHKAAVIKTDSAKSPAKEVGSMHTKTIKTAIPESLDSTRIVKTASNLKTGDSKKTVSGTSVKGRREIYENGVASWIRDDDINPNKYYALHRTAPVGTIIKVTNKMNNKYVFVKVVGTLPNTGDNTDLVIKISKASAEKLGVRDAKFQSELNYGVNEKP